MPDYTTISSQLQDIQTTLICICVLCGAILGAHLIRNLRR